MAKVELRDGESQESLLKRFRKRVSKERILSTVKKKRYFMSKSEERRIARRKAIRKQKQRERKRKERYGRY